tara:strand:- start:221 stop:430 length:210 start_codon:yes stop_codon:yes gene_type:complete
MSSNKRKQHLRMLILQYVQSVLEMATTVDPKNINQVISLMKANIRVLENDVKSSFNKREYEDFDYKELN